MKNVCIIGLGALGKRHLQAVSQLSGVAIFCIDNNRGVFDEIAEQYKRHDIVCADDYDILPNQIDLAIVATTANVRREVFEKLISSSDISNIIFEKVLFQKMEDYDIVSKILEEKKIKAWVNCPRRYWNLWRDIKLMLSDQDVFEIHISGAEWGMCCNTIHYLDIISFIADNDEIDINNSYFTENIIESKRPGFKETFGIIGGACGRCRSFTISCYQGDVKTSIEIVFANGKIVVDEPTGITVFLSGGEPEFRSYVPQYVSETTRYVAEDILFNNTCSLTTYWDSMKAHKSFISLLMAHFEKHGGKKGLCQIT